MQSRSAQLAQRILSTRSPDHLSAMLRQLHPDDLADAWAAMSAIECGLIWARYRRNWHSTDL